MAQARTFEQMISVAKETVYGTAVPPTMTWPVTSAGGQFNMTETFDEGRRGIAALDFDALPDGAHGEFTCEGFVYPVFFGNLLLGLFGSEVLSGAADPYTHTFALAPSPPSFTMQEQVFATGPNNGFQYTGFRPGNVNMSFDAKSGALSYSTQGMSLAPTLVTTTLSAPTGELRPFSGWLATITGTGLTTRVTKGELNFTRELEIVHTATGVQTPRFINTGPLKVDGTFTLSVEDATDFSAVLADTREAVTISFIQTGSPSRQVSFTMSNLVLNAAPMEWDRSGVSVYDKLTVRGLYNATDVGPATAFIKNNRSTVY